LSSDRDSADLLLPPSRNKTNWTCMTSVFGSITPCSLLGVNECRITFRLHLQGVMAHNFLRLSLWLLTQPSLRPWKWHRDFSSEGCMDFNRIHCVISQKKGSYPSLWEQKILHTNLTWCPCNINPNITTLQPVTYSLEEELLLYPPKGIFFALYCSVVRLWRWVNTLKRQPYRMTVMCVWRCQCWLLSHGNQM
jgi:hypothetical protein